MKFHHVGIVQSIERSAALYRQPFGLQPVSDLMTDNTQRANVQFLASDAAATSVELIEPLPGQSPVRGALERGGGIHHLCFEAADITESVRQAKSHGAVCVCQPVPAAAFNRRRIAFLFYRGIGLIEFVEAAEQ